MIMSFRSRAIRSRDENLESLEQFPDEGEIFQVFDQHKRLDKFDQQHHKQLNDKSKVRSTPTQFHRSGSNCFLRQKSNILHWI